MKAFAFRLEQALRWRGEQASLQRSRLSAAAGNAARSHAALESSKTADRNAALAAKQAADGASLEAYARFAERSKARIRGLERQARDAETALAGEMNRLVEANRDVRVLEKLRHTERNRWHRALDREIDAFAGEAFLHRLQSNKRTEIRDAHDRRAPGFTGIALREK
jgi:hypothetical protein